MLLRCHCIKLKLVLQGLKRELLAQSALIKLALKYQRLLLQPFVNQLDDVQLTNDYFRQDTATAHTSRTTINYLVVFYLWPSR
jgi:hypothetical protein